jgi:hypothetical protein
MVSFTSVYVCPISAISYDSSQLEIRKVYGYILSAFYSLTIDRSVLQYLDNSSSKMITNIISRTLTLFSKISLKTAPVRNEILCMGNIVAVIFTSVVFSTFNG